MDKLEIFIQSILAAFRAVASKLIYVEKKIDDLEFGGRNILPSTNFKAHGGIWEEVDLYRGARTVKNTVTVDRNSNNIGIAIRRPISFSGSGTYTLSFWYKSLISHERQRLGCYIDFNMVSGGTTRKSLPKTKYLNDVVDGWTLYSESFDIDEFSNIKNLYVYGDNFSVGTEVLFTMPKLEEGNKPTASTPALEDLVSNWEQQDEEALDFIKEKPTKLSQFSNDLDIYLKQQTYSRSEAVDKFIPRVGVVDIFDTKTFKASPIVPNGTLDKHAVNLEQLQALKPHIGTNGNWFIGTNDTGINATGNKGEKGEKGDRGERGLPGDPVSSTDTLDDVNQRGNYTTKQIEVHNEQTGIRADYRDRGMYIYAAEEIIGSVTGSKDEKAGIYLSMTLGSYLRFRIQEETNSLAGANFQSRVSGREALNARDFVTLSQLKSYDAEIIETPEFSFQQFRDVIIVRGSNTTIELPEIHHSEAEEWNGKKLKIVPHQEVSTSLGYTNTFGQEGNMKIKAGRAIELMFLEGEWYEV